jgi:hypothetical protein
MPFLTFFNSLQSRNCKKKYSRNPIYQIGEGRETNFVDSRLPNYKIFKVGVKYFLY